MAVAEMKRVFGNDYFSISIDEDERLLYYKIYGYPKFSDVIRQGHDELYRIASGLKKENRLRSLVADLTEAKILLTTDIRFIGTVSYPRLARTGIRDLAILLTDDIHVNINVKKTLEFMGPHVFSNVLLCPDLDEALAWFRKLNDRS